MSKEDYARQKARRDEAGPIHGGKQLALQLVEDLASRMTEKVPSLSLLDMAGWLVLVYARRHCATHIRHLLGLARAKRTAKGRAAALRHAMMYSISDYIRHLDQVEHRIEGDHLGRKEYGNAVYTLAVGLGERYYPGTGSPLMSLSERGSIEREIRETEHGKKTA